MGVMPTVPPVSLGISPSSSASTGTGLDNFGGYQGGYTGEINVGGGSPGAGLIVSLAVLAGIALGGRYLWGKL